MTTHPSNAYSDLGLYRHAWVKGHRHQGDSGLEKFKEPFLDRVSNSSRFTNAPCSIHCPLHCPRDSDMTRKLYPTACMHARTHSSKVHMLMRLVILYDISLDNCGIDIDFYCAL